MKAVINGSGYDTEQSERIAQAITESNTSAELYQSPAGQFFLVEEVEWLDNQKLGRGVAVTSLAPELSDANAPEWTARFRVTHEFRLLSNRQAMEWCIKSLVPDTFRGYLLDAI